MDKDYQASIDLLCKGLSELKISIEETSIEKFRKYLHALMTLPYNLTAIKTPLESITHHFLDSLAPLQLMAQHLSASICDVGSGAGFPLLPIKIVRSNLNCTFIDSRIKSISFIDLICKQLNLTDCKTIHNHTTQLRKQTTLRYQVIISRAFGDVHYILEECLPLLESKGYFFLYKGPLVHKELENVPKKILSCVDIVSALEIKVPFLDKKRFLLIIQKK